MSSEIKRSRAFIRLRSDGDEIDAGVAHIIARDIERLVSLRAERIFFNATCSIDQFAQAIERATVRFENAQEAIARLSSAMRPPIRIPFRGSVYSRNV